MDRRFVLPSRRQFGTGARAAGVVAAALLAVAPLLFGVLGHGGEPVCGPGGQVLRALPGPLSCVHVDEAPPGVDVTEPVSTAELKDRDGAGLKAYQAAEELGVPMSAASNATTPAVPCDGDGAGGYRIQPMYVVEASRPNRFSSLLPSFKLWAAGTDDVVNRSAALTGGVRDLRYVTEAGSVAGTCEAKVLNVTVPAGSMSSFGATINAVQAQGFTDPTRKYLLWTDASVLCGVANLYLSDSPGQGNPNNGAAPQYARVDSGCWGFGDGAGNHSVEAHELVHTLGAVSGSAVHATRNGHCWDENDTMCYADGDGHAMVQVCPREREYLLDCNSDDYFSTFPDPGSYLSSHWNSADSRYLIGGGDGSGGGATGVPTVLGATIAVNNPAVPGLVTQVAITPVLPAGRTVASVTWRSARADCLFGTPGELQSTVSCPVGASGSTTVTATIVDSTGAAKTLSSLLTFATGTARPVTLVARVDGQPGTPASVCTSAGFPVEVTATDQATGLPVRGLPVSVTRQTAAMTTPGAVGTARTTGAGVASASGVASVATTYAAKTALGTVYAAASSAPVSALPSRCSVTLTGPATPTDLYYGDTVTVGGRLTRTVAGETVGVVGAAVPVRLTWVENGITRVQQLTSVRTSSTGEWSAAVKPTRDGRLGAALPASSSWDGASLDLGAVSVRIPETDLTATVDRTDVGSGAPVVVGGRLTRTAGTLTTGLAGATVSVKVTPAGSTRATTVGSARTLADGSYSVSVPLRVSGLMTASYAGVVGQPADTVTLGPVQAGTWSTALTLGATKVATTVNLAGTLSRAYAGTTSGAPSVTVRVYFTPTSTGVPVLTVSTSTRADGSFTARTSPKVSGSYTAKVLGLVGYADATSSPAEVTVP